MWLNFVGRDNFFMRDGFHLIGKGAISCDNLLCLCSETTDSRHG